MIVIDMGMPQNCIDCPLQYDNLYCSVNEEPFTSIAAKKRDYKCPIVAEVEVVRDEETK